jgi:hypothetical protein
MTGKDNASPEAVFNKIAILALDAASGAATLVDTVLLRRGRSRHLHAALHRCCFISAPPNTLHRGARK